MVLRLSHACIACFLGILLTNVSPAEELAGDLSRITIREALLLAQQQNPNLKAALSGLPGFEGRLQQASLKPAMELAFEMENFLGSGNFSGTSGTEFTLVLSQLIELGDKRERRKKVVDAQKGLLLSEIEQQRLELTSEVLVRFVQVAADQELFELAQREQVLAERTLATVGDRVEAALAPEAERYRARAALEKAIAGTQLADLSRQRSLAWLAALWGGSHTRLTGVNTNFYHLPELIDLEQLLAAIDQSPLALSVMKSQELREAELQLAQTGSKRDLTLNSGVRRFQETNDNALVLSLSVPLQSDRRNHGAVNMARAGLDQATVESEAALSTTRSLLVLRYQELLQVKVGIESLRKRVLPQLEAALEGTEKAYVAGRYSYLELIDAQSRLIDLQRNLIEQTTRYHELLANIEQLTGQELVRGTGEDGEQS